jgi:hypothetical protein
MAQNKVLSHKIDNPTPEGPVLATPGRGYFALPPKRARMSCPRVILEQALLLSSMFYSLLMFYIFSGHFRIKAYFVNTISFGQK